MSVTSRERNSTFSQHYYLRKNLQRRKKYIFFSISPSSLSRQPLSPSFVYLSRPRRNYFWSLKKKEKSDPVASFLRLPRPKRIKATPRCVVSPAHFCTPARFSRNSARCFAVNTRHEKRKLRFYAS